MNKAKSAVFSLLLAGISVSMVGCGANDAQVLNMILASSAQQGGISQVTTGNSSTKTALIRAGLAVLSGLVQNHQAKQTGTPQTYQGAYTAQLLTWSAQAGGYVESKAVSTTATSTLYISNNGLGISMPAITANGAAMTQVTLTNLVANGQLYKLGDNSMATEGKMTLNGKTYDLANAYVELAYSGTEALQYSASIYFDLDESIDQYRYAINLTFKK